MIRALRPEDLDQVMQIWLDANLEAHCFLPESYWCDHMEEVRAALPAAQVFVYQDWEGLQGFAGLIGDYLAGLFVRRAARPRGIGRALLERAKEGLSALKTNDAITEAAQTRADELLQLFDHTRPDGRSCFTALGEAGVSYRAAGENIAMGYPTPEAVVNGWMNSPGHRANILNRSFTTIGVGYNSQRNCWVQMFVG